MKRCWLRSASPAVLGLATLTLLALGCNSETPKPPPPKPAAVIVEKAIKKEIVEYEDFTGRLEAYKKIELQARVTGHLQKVLFVEGTRVEAKVPLFEIDPRPYKAELDKTTASHIQSQARMQRLEGDLTRAEDLARTRGAIAKEELEKIKGDYAEARAAVGVTAASQASAQLFYDLTKVTSPIAGMIGRSLDEGNLVKADSTILATIVTQDPIYAYFDVDQSTMLRLARLVKDGKIKASASSSVPVKMGLSDEPSMPHLGTTDFEDNAIDPNTGTRRLRAVFKNKDGFFTPGLFVRIRFQVGVPHQATMVPEQGIGTDQGQKFVYVVNDQSKVEYRKVKTGMLFDNLRVVEQGVRPGELIIVSGLQRIRPSSAVTATVRPASTEAAKEPPKVSSTAPAK